jgi:hypothetical protein
MTEGYFKEYENIIKHLKVYNKKEAKKCEEEEEAFEQEFFKTFTLFKRALQNTKINKESEKVQMNTRRTNYKFPEVKLPNFDGNLENWILFRDLFESMVIKSTDLSPAEKMHYLIGALSEELKRIFVKLEYSEAGFNAAWNELKERFDNKEALIDRHISALFIQKSIPKDSPGEIRKLIDNFSINLNQLQILGEKVEMWDSIVINMVKFRLNDELKKDWQSRVIEIRKSEKTNQKKLPTWKEMKMFLEEKYQILEQMQTQQRTFVKSITSRSNPPIKSSTRSFIVNQPEQQSTNATILCSICSQPHKTFKCPELEKLKSVEEKRCKINEKRLCFNCLRKNHQRSQCTNQKRCFHCGDNYHTIICFKGNKVQTETTLNNENKPLIIQKKSDDFKNKKQEYSTISSLCSSYNSRQK